MVWAKKTFPMVLRLYSHDVTSAIASIQLVGVPWFNFMGQHRSSLPCVSFYHSNTIRLPWYHYCHDLCGTFHLPMKNCYSTTVIPCKKKHTSFWAPPELLNIPLLIGCKKGTGDYITWFSGDYATAGKPIFTNHYFMRWDMIESQPNSSMIPKNKIPIFSIFQSQHFWLVVWNIFWFFHSVGNFIIPTDELIFSRGVGQPPVIHCSIQTFFEHHDVEA